MAVRTRMLVAHGVACCSIALLAPLAHAQSPTADARAEDTSELEGLLEETVVSTATIGSETAGTAPATIWTISAEDLRRYGVQTLDEAIGYLTMGMVVESSLDYAEVGARGMLINGDYGGHMLMLLDGHALNEQWDGAVYFDRSATIPFEMIDHIEVVLGPGSVLYGSNAMLGVINIITKRARDYAGAHLVVQSQLGSSVRVAAGMGQEFRVADMQGEITAQVEYYGSRGPPLSLGPQDEGGLIWGGTVREGRFARAPAGYLRASLGDLSLDVRAASARRGNPTSTYGNFDDPQSYDRDRWLSGDLRYVKRVSSRVEVSARAYADHYDYYQRLPTVDANDCLAGQDAGCIYRLKGDTQWAGLELRANVDWLGDARYTTLVGADGRLRGFSSWDHYEDLATGERVPTDAYDGREKALGAYVQQEARPTTWLSLNVGARFDADERYGSHLSPRAAVGVSPWAMGTVKAIYSEAFRAPSAFERYYADPTWWIEATGLRPELVRSFELTLEQRLGTHRAVVGGFASRWQDLVSEEALGAAEVAAAIAAGALEPDVEDAYQYRNTSAARSYGVNMGLEGTTMRRRLHYALTATLADTARDVVQGDGEPRRFDVAAQLFGNARMAYDFAGNLPVLGVAVRWIGPRRVDASSFRPYPVAKPFVAARVALSGAIAFVRGLSYDVAGDYTPTAQSPYAIGP
ncbi:MAG: TonB-dependent receptor, partial [Myxococcota bacterium]